MRIDSLCACSVNGEGFLELGREDVKQNKSSNDVNTSTCNVEQLVESDKGVDVNAHAAKEQGVGSLNPTSLASKIRDIKFQMLQGANEGILKEAEKVDTSREKSPLRENNDVADSNIGKNKESDVVNEESESDMENVYKETGSFMASKSGGGGGTRKKSLYERWKDDYYYNTYEDDECRDLMKEQLALC
ncbi:hypothetical protein Tco_0511269 [Tanacetum coccineum]